ncbi:S8 family serine peptidase [Salinithrix halophila]|uniref:S8 family serine peptidase n=1 Tax=Salinithrix halophila TaxID=1485204 RepID=A0ABV8JDA8_9BACL
MKKVWPVVVCTTLLLSGLGLNSSSPAQASPSEGFLNAKLREFQKHKLAPGVPVQSGKRVSVLVEMNSAPTAAFQKLAKSEELPRQNANQYRKELQQEQQTLTSDLKEVAPQLQVKETYDTVFAGMSVRLKGEEVEKLAALPEIKRIYPIRKYRATMKESSPLIGATSTWKEKDSQGNSLTGKGMKVAVVDSGVDAKHPDLKGKIVGGYDFVEKDRTPQDEAGHGTHVAGTIAAKGKIKGVAPDASILAYRVLDENGVGTNEDILAGIDRAVKDGADVMNLSLGASVNVPDGPLVQAVKRATEHGVVTVVANGNDGPEGWSAGTPGTAMDVISVGASTKVIPLPVVQVAGDKKKMEMNIITSSPAFPMKGTHSIVNLGNGKAKDFKKKSLKGKILLVKRNKQMTEGGITIVDDVAIRAKKAKAKALIVYNDHSGELSVTPMIPDDEAKPVPTATLSGAYGKYLKKKIAAGKKKIVLRSVKQERMIDFSSRGPGLGTWAIKPDVTAPGVDILSTVPRKVDKKGYEKMSGTSMAAPHVAGAAALLRQKHADWDPQQIKAALSNTAVNLKDSEGKRAPYIQQGSGRIDILKALQTDTLVTPNNLSFGLFKPQSGTQEAERMLQVRNTVNQAKTYTIRAELDGGKSGIRVEVPSQLQVNSGSTEQIPVKISFDTGLPVGQYTGTIYIKEGSQEWKVPFIALNDAKDYELINSFGLDTLFLSPNGDKKLDTALLTYYMPVSPDRLKITARKVEENSKPITLHSAKNPQEGYMDRFWNGKDAKGKKLPDALYLLEATANKGKARTSAQSIVFVDKTAPKIKWGKTGKKPQLKGKIHDLLVKKDSLGLLHFMHIMAGVDIKPVTLQWKREKSSKWKRIPLSLEKLHKNKGKFTYTFKKKELKKGKNTILVRVKDAAKNSRTQKIRIKK